MANWFTRQRYSEAPVVAPPVAPPVPPDPVLERVVTRAVHRALLALEAGDEANAREWMWALFHTDLRVLI